MIPCARCLGAHQAAVGCARGVQTQREPGGLCCGCFKVPSNQTLSISGPRDVAAEWGDKLEEYNLLGLDMEFPGLWHPWPPAAPSGNLSSGGCRGVPRRGEEAMDAQQFLYKCMAQQR